MFKSSLTAVKITHNTIHYRREKTLALKGMHFIGMGISGGEEGARNGPSLMVGGAHEQYVHLEPIFSKCAAQVKFVSETFIFYSHSINLMPTFSSSF